MGHFSVKTYFNTPPYTITLKKGPSSEFNGAFLKNNLRLFSAEISLLRVPFNVSEDLEM